MLFRRLGALVAAFSIVAFPLAANAADPAPTPGMVNGPQIDAQAQIDALKDIPTNSWAYQAIIDLVNDGIIVGYPDGTFKGNRPLTRYEAAVMVERAVQFLTKKLANPQTASAVTQKDLDALRSLLDEFKGDIDSLKLRVGDIDSRLKSVEAAQKNDEAVAARAQIHAYIQLRPGSFNDAVAAYNGDGRPLQSLVGLAPVSGQTQVGSGGNVSAPRYLTGQNGTGFGYSLLRVLVDGQLDPRTSYHIRAENVYNWDTADAFNAGALNGTFAPGGVAESSPNLGAPGALQTFTVNGASYPRNTTFRLNYAYAQFQDPKTGLLVEGGRINDSDSSLGLGWNDQFNGGEIGYVKNGVNIRGGYAFDFPDSNQYNGSCKAINNAPPLGGGVNAAVGGQPCGTTSQTFFGSASTVLAKNFTVGVAAMDDENAVISSWNPSVCYNGSKTPCSAAALHAACAPAAVSCSPYGLYQTAVTSIGVGTISARFASPNMFSKNMGLSLEAEGLTRFGDDPWTHKNWQQAQALWLQAKIGAFNPTPFRWYVEGGGVQSGLNSANMHTGLESAPFYENQFLGNTNGYRIGYAGINYWFSQFGRIGVYYNGYDLIPGTTYPVGTATCPGCFLTHDIGQAVFLQTVLQF